MERETREHFIVSVKVFEASDFPRQNMSTLVSVSVGDEIKNTHVERDTDTPFFNEYFVFDLNTTFSALMDTIVTLSIFEPRKKYQWRKMLGCISLDVATVWAHPDHRVKRWMAVTLPSDRSGKETGFIKSEIIVEAPEAYKQLPQLSPVESPGVFGGVRARYMVRLYHCVGMDVPQSDKEPPDVFIRVAFAGNVGSTTKRKLLECPEWNEQITFVELFPPLFQKITMELCLLKKVLATKIFYFTDITNISSTGFLPTYGPTYVHFYSSECSYCASLLMSINTEYVTTYKYLEAFHRGTMTAIPAVPPSQYGAIDNFMVFGVLFDAMLMSKKYENANIHLNFSFGKAGRRSLQNDSLKTNTASFKALPGNSDFVYMPINEKKPCVFVRSEWPNTRHRLSNSNLLSKLANDLTEILNVSQESISRDRPGEAKNILKTNLQYFKGRLKKVSGHFSKGVTPFDLERVGFIVKIITELVDLIHNMNTNDMDIMMRVAKKCTTVLNAICEDPQETLPYLIISLNQGGTVIGCGKLHPRHLIFSKTESKIGSQCGKISSIFLKNEVQDIVGRVDIWLWLGFWNQVSYCLHDLPPGHEHFSKAVSLPSNVKYVTSEMYNINCYIFSGQVVSASSADGLCDLYVRILVSNQSRQTKTIRKSLAPFWKEVIVFTNIQLYPHPEYIKEDPPSVTVEVWDQSNRSATVLDTALVLPEVRLQPVDSSKECNVRWIKLSPNTKILAAFEIVQVTEQGVPGRGRLSKLMPTFIDPAAISYRLEVVFWGIRAVNANAIKGVSHPQVVMQWGSVELSSDVLIRIGSSPNFQHNPHKTHLELPQTKLYAPPLVLRLLSDSKCIGCKVDTDIDRYIVELPTEKAWTALGMQRKSMIARAKSRYSTEKATMPDLIPLIDVDNRRRSSPRFNAGGYLKVKVISYCWPLFKIHNCLRAFICLFKNKNIAALLEEEDEDEEQYDWWYKYFIGDVRTYTSELEAQPEFGGFVDVLKTFAIKQQKTNALKPFINVKAMICLYRWPTDVPVVTKEGDDPEIGVLRQTGISDGLKVLVRVYCIKALNLHPADLNNKADPYIEIETPSNVVSDKANYIPRQLNPVFGRSFEIIAAFPKDSILTVRVMDWDRFTVHDVIGETTIDLENRFYSKHRGNCGLSKTYSAVGYNTWRDVEKPKIILERLCNTYNLSLPQYYEKSVLVASKEFVGHDLTTDKEENQERLALLALQRWQEVPIVGHPLVPEHVESRPLYHRDRPGLVQGTLEMWVDMFDVSMGRTPPPLDITHRPPQPYELRVVIWNTERVPLVDDSFLVGRKHTDIFVKGWLGESNTVQSTDVHYTSVDGKGNFNWRFIFQFLYFRPEKRMVIYKKHILDVGKTEKKMPAVLHLQVWDSDLLSPDDFIGSMALELCRIPRGARTRRTCTIPKELTPYNSVDLFKVKRLRGWWPFQFRDEGKKKSVAAGYLEADFQLLTADEAQASPAGLGRDEPAALPPPIRAEFKVRFWLAPLRILLHIIWGVHKGKLILCLLLCAVSIFIMIGIYSVPMFLIKKLMGA